MQRRLSQEQPRASLLHMIGLYSELGSFRLVDTHSLVLHRLNQYVQTEGGPIRGIEVTLTPEEQNLYQRDSLDLVPTTDFTEFVTALNELYETIVAEGGDSNDEGGTQG